MLPFRKHRAASGSHEDDILEVIDRDASAKIVIARDSQKTSEPNQPASADMDIPIDVELEAPRLPRPTPPPRSSRRAIPEPIRSEPPPAIVDPVVTVRDPIGPSLVPVSLPADDVANEDAGSETMRVRRAPTINVRRPSCTAIAWAAVWVFFGALGSMSAAYLLGYVPGPQAGSTAPPSPAAAPLPAKEDAITLPSTKREAHVVAFGEDQALVFGAVLPAATSSAASAPTTTATANPGAPKSAVAHAKPKGDKVAALIGPTLDSPKHGEPARPNVEPKNGEAEAQAKPRRREPLPGSPEALMEAQLKAASK